MPPILIAVLALLPLLVAAPARALPTWSGPFALPAGILAPDAFDFTTPTPIVDANGHVLLVFRTSGGLRVAEFASDGSLGAATAIPAAVNVNVQPIDVVDSQPSSSGGTVLLLRGPAINGGTRFLVHRLADGTFAAPPIVVAGVPWTAMAVRAGEILLAGSGVVRTVAIAGDGTLAAGASTTLVPSGDGPADNAGVALDTDGAAVALFSVGRQLRQASRSAAGVWSSTSVLFELTAPETMGPISAASVSGGRLLGAFATLRGPAPSNSTAGTIKEIRMVTREPGQAAAAPVAVAADTLAASQSFGSDPKMQCVHGADGSLGIALGRELCDNDVRVYDYRAAAYGPLDALAGVVGVPGGVFGSNKDTYKLPAAFGYAGFAVRGGRLALAQSFAAYADVLHCATANPNPPAFTATLQGVTGVLTVDAALTALESWDIGANGVGVPGTKTYGADTARTAVDDDGNAVLVVQELPFQQAANARWVYFAFGTPGAESGPAPGATATPTSSAPTPTPTATAAVPGLADPVAAKAAVKCQAAVAKARSAAQAARTKTLAACGGKLAACVQTKPGDAGCLAKGTAFCAKEKGKLVGADQKLAGAIGKACGGLATGDLLGAAGVGAAGASVACAGLGATSVTDLASFVACQLDAMACTAADVAEGQQPRLLQLLTLAGSDLNDSPCLDLGTGTGGDVGDAQLGKTVDACRAAIAKAGQTFVASRVKGLNGCAAAATICVQTKPADTGCLAKAGATCTKLFATRAADAGKLHDAIAAKCGGVAFPTLAAASGLDLAGLGTRCAALGIASVDTLAHYGDCLERIAVCATDGATVVAVPRIAELLHGVGQPFGESFCP